MKIEKIEIDNMNGRAVERKHSRHTSEAVADTSAQNKHTHKQQRQNADYTADCVHYDGTGGSYGDDGWLAGEVSGGR